MKKTFISATLILAATAALFSFDTPKDWFKAGSDPEKYDMGIDKGGGENGKNVATIKSKEEKIKGFGTLMQTSVPGKYLGKRVRMTGSMRSDNVGKWAGFWFRVDGKESDKKPLAFDNMQKRSVEGTTGWKKYELVLDVPNEASAIAYGALLSGTGQIWFDNISFEIVDDKVKTTGN